VTGIRPRFVDQFATHGIRLPASLFRPDAQLG